MIFVTVGSQKFQFDRLLKAVDQAIDDGVITDEVNAQIGASEYLPKHYSFCRFMDKEDFSTNLKNASLIITHGGTGVITGALKNNKKVLAIPRLKKYGEHVDDHQTQLLIAFEQANYLCVCNDADDFNKKIIEVMTGRYTAYQSNTNEFLKRIRAYIETI